MDDAYPTTTCPHCGQEIEYANDLAINEIICPQCSARLIVDAGRRSAANADSAIPAQSEPVPKAIPPRLPQQLYTGSLSGMGPLRKKRQIGVIGISALVLLALGILVVLAILGDFVMRLRNPTVESLGARTDVLRLKTLTLGTNKGIGDVVTLEMTRFTHHMLDGHISCSAHFFITGREPVAVDKGDNVHVEVDGRTFSWRTTLPAEAKTNSLGDSLEVVLADVPIESLLALTNCTSVAVRFHGLLRDLDIPMTPENVDALRVFARSAVRDLAWEYKPVQLPAAPARAVE